MQDTVTAQLVVLLDYPHGEIDFSFPCPILSLLNVSNIFMLGILQYQELLSII